MDIVPRDPRPAPQEPEEDLPPRWTRLRFVRCEACGAKALVAASQCPQCGHALGLRNSLGDPVPLAHCPTCDLYYPRKRGECRWCGTKAPKSRLLPLSLGAVALLGVLGVSWGVLPFSITTGVATLPAETPVVPAADSAPMPKSLVDSGVAPTFGAAGDRVVVPVSDSVTRDSTIGSSVSVAVAASATPLEPEAPAAAPMPVVADPTPDRKVAPPRGPSVRAVPPKPRSVRWVSTTVRRWVRVRVNASHGSRTVALIGPDTRVQLGEQRDGWQRLRATGISGWVDRAQFHGEAGLRP